MDDLHKTIVRKLRTEKRPYKELQKLTGVPASTLQCIACGISRSPRYITLQKVAQLYGIAA